MKDKMEGLKMKYFVLNPKSKYRGDIYAQASRLAMLAYADRIKKCNPLLCGNLRSWIEVESNKEDKIPEIAVPKLNIMND